jgi:hypothetical protein
MKKNLLTLFLFSLLQPVFSQVYNYERRDPRLAIVTSEKIGKSLMISDFLPDYPHDYFSKLIDYVSVDIICTVQGKTITAANSSDLLTEEQKMNLSRADLGSDVSIRIKFSYKDPEDDMRGSNNKIKEMDYIFLLAPHLEAAFPGAYTALTSYLNLNLFNPVSSLSSPDKILNVFVSFSIDENGHIINSELNGSTTNAIVDKMILDVMKNMPLWKPAENLKGEKVKQVFKLYFKFNSGGC